MSIEEMAEFIRANSLGFLSIEGLYRALDLPGRNSECPQYCDACFTKDYPTRLTDQEGTDDLRHASLLGSNA